MMNKPADFRNGENRRERNGRFASGNGGGPGRPKGSGESARAAVWRIKAELLATWDELGPDAVRRLARERPGEYLKIVAALLPREPYNPVAEVELVRQVACLEAMGETRAAG